MKRRAFVVAGLSALVLSACAPRIRPYDGPEVTELRLFKARRKLYLMHGEDVLRAYDVALGFAPRGAKRQEGDGRTPEGRYLIDRRNARSAYFRSIGLSYPDENDVAQALRRGVEPGGDIFIHGQPNGSWLARRGDWTAGCIAVRNREMAEIWAMVPLGTPIVIMP